jgi:hypothetical protein
LNVCMTGSMVLGSRFKKDKGPEQRCRRQNYGTDPYEELSGRKAGEGSIGRSEGIAGTIGAGDPF